MPKGAPKAAKSDEPQVVQAVAVPAAAAATTTTTTTTLTTGLLDDGKLLVAEEKKGCVFSACICCYSGFRGCDDGGGCLVGCEGSGQCLCTFYECCIAINGTPKGCGLLLASDESGRFRDIWFGIGICCCNCILKPPTICCGSSCDHCCCTSVSSFPFHERFVPFPILVCCFCQLFPNFGCCQPAHLGTKPAQSTTVEVTTTTTAVQAMVR